MVRFAEPAGLYPDFRISALSALFYFSNWWQIAAHSNYFFATGPIYPLTHTWSLAVEEQFYLVWPLVVLAVMTLSRTFARGLRNLLVVSAIGRRGLGRRNGPALQPRRQHHPALLRHRHPCPVDPDRCRAGLLVDHGPTSPGEHGHGPSGHVAHRPARLLTLVGAVGLAGTLALTSPRRGPPASTTTAASPCRPCRRPPSSSVRCACPAGPLARFLALSPLVWMGTVSYGAYLWHYPVFIFLDPDRTGQTGLALLAIRFATTFSAGRRQLLPGRAAGDGGDLLALPQGRDPAVALMAVTVAVIVAGTVVPATAAVPVGRFRGPTSTKTPPKVVVLGDSTGLHPRLRPPGHGAGRHHRGQRRTVRLRPGHRHQRLQRPAHPRAGHVPRLQLGHAGLQQWPARDEQAVADTAPGDVVLFVAGSWEAQDVPARRSVDEHRAAVRPALPARPDAAGRRGSPRPTAPIFDFTTMPAPGLGRRLPRGTAPRGLVDPAAALRPADREGGGGVPRAGERHRLRRHPLARWRLHPSTSTA